MKIDDILVFERMQELRLLYEKAPTFDVAIEQLLEDKFLLSNQTKTDLPKNPATYSLIHLNVFTISLWDAFGYG